MDYKGIILLTGYEAFGDFKVNPSIAACMRLNDKIYNGYRVVVEEISMRFEEVKDEIEGHVDKYKPAAVLSTGVSSEGACIKLERVAINVTTATGASKAEQLPEAESIRAGGPVGYFSTLPLQEFLEGLKRAGIPVLISNSAGTFGCNLIFYQLMDYLDRQGLNIPAGFIHVPRLPEQALDGKTPSMALDLSAHALDAVVEMISKDL
jgi:pyroglutamyl-peptidase